MHAELGTESVEDEDLGLGKDNPACWLRRRHAVAIVAHLGLFIVYVLRVILSVAVVPMSEEFGWSSDAKGWVLSAFFIGYITLQVAGGFLSIRFGPKLVFGLGVAIPSLLTAITPPVASNYAALIALRILTGVGEAVTYPSLHSLLGAWAPMSERSQIVGFVWAGAYLGTTCAFPVAGALIESGAGWQSVFYLAGGAGAIWVVLWYVVVSDRPETDPHITASERRHIVSSLPPTLDPSTPVPWRVIFSQPSVWGVVAGHTAHNWLFYTLLTYLPSYLKSELGFDIKTSGAVSVLPYLGCFLGSTGSGQLADWLIKHRGWSVVWTRRAFQCAFEVGAGVVLVAAGYTSDVVLAVVCVTASVTFVGAGSAGGYAPNILDLAPFHGGILMGISNTIATLPGIISPVLTGYIVQSKTRSAQSADEWREVFWLGLGVALVGNCAFAVLARGTEVKELCEASADAGLKRAEISSASTAPLMDTPDP